MWRENGAQPEARNGKKILNERFNQPLNLKLFTVIIEDHKGFRYQQMCLSVIN